MKATRRKCLEMLLLGSVATIGLRRRRAEAAGSSDPAVQTTTSTGAVLATTLFNVTLPPYNADPTGNSDSAAAFQAALLAISKAGKGVLYIPAGLYVLSKPLSCGNAALTITGEGSASSVLVITHTQTALTVTCESMQQCVTIRDVGFTPVASEPAGTAIAITHPNQPSGWPGCVIENVDLGLPYPNYTSFLVGLSLTNLWRGHIENVNWHSNVGAVHNSRFVELGGTCIDNSFKSCTIDGVGTGFALGSYAEGLHIVDCVVIGTVGLTTGNRAFSGNGVTSPFINLLGLYIAGSEFNTSACSLDLFLVDTGWISNCHFSTRESAYPAVLIQGSTLLHLTSCSMTGAFNAGTPRTYNGIETLTAEGSVSTNGISIDDCDFTNLSCGVTYGPGTFNSTATGIRMFAPSNASLISLPIVVNGFTLAAEQDLSGNTTNTSVTVGSTLTRTIGPTKFAYTRP